MSANVGVYTRRRNATAISRVLHECATRPGVAIEICNSRAARARARARSRESGFSSRGCSLASALSRTFIRTRAVVCVYLHEIAESLSRRVSRLVTRSSSEENGRSRSLCACAVVDLIPRSRATHITGFLDSNRRRTTVVASRCFVGSLARRFGGHPLCAANNRVYTAEALMRAKADNLLRNTGSPYLRAGQMFPIGRLNQCYCFDRARRSATLSRGFV